jgi:hypothetical protein
LLQPVILHAYQISYELYAQYFFFLHLLPGSISGSWSWLLYQLFLELPLHRLRHLLTFSTSNFYAHALPPETTNSK